MVGRSGNECTAKHEPRVVPGGLPADVAAWLPLADATILPPFKEGASSRLRAYVQSKQRASPGRARGARGRAVCCHAVRCSLVVAVKLVHGKLAGRLLGLCQLCRERAPNAWSCVSIERTIQAEKGVRCLRRRVDRRSGDVAGTGGGAAAGGAAAGRVAGCVAG